ncbi:MAG: hypothetical protein QXR58_01820, partial [Candidatus Micrarchaeaceae archaeon]
MILLGVLFYLSGIILGVGLAGYFFDNEIREIFVKYAFSFPIGFSISAFLVLAFDAYAGGFKSYMMALASIAMLAASAAIFYKRRKLKMFSFSLLVKQIRSEKLFYLLLILVIAMLIIFQYRGVYYGAKGIWGGDNYGTDFLFHVSIGNSLIYSGWPPKLLYADGAPNVFPFIADFYTAMLAYTGIPVVFALYLMNFLLYFSIAVLFVYFISLITKHRVAAIAGFILFLFCSLGMNMVFLYLFHISLPYLSYAQIKSSTSNILGFLTTPLFNFSNPIGSNFAPQHDLVLGFPMALIIIIQLYLTFFDKRLGARKYHAPWNFSRKSMALSAFTGLLIGMMPLIHPFSLVFVAIFAAFAFLYSMAKNGRAKAFLYYWVPLSAVA